MKKLMLMMFAGGVLAFGGCTKSGPPGPQGPAGYDGLNANVVGSNPFDVSSWSYSSSNVAFSASFTDADITTAVANHGQVEQFLFYPSDGTWRNLPDIVGGTQFYSRFSQGGFEIYYANIDGTVPSNPGLQTFRTVVIAPSQKAAHPNTNWKNYNEAMAALSTAPAATAAQ
jgi:hypothetical protein